MPRLEWQAYESLLHHAKLCDTDPEYDWDDYPKDRRHAMNAVLDLEELQASHKALVDALRPCLGHLADYLDKCGPNKAQPTLENAIAVIEKAEKLTK